MVKSEDASGMKMWGTGCVSRSSGKNEPAHYMLKIDSFSLLSQSANLPLQSAVFEASAHKWRLELYPNGDEENRGNYISLYLIICDTESLGEGWDVHVYFRLFVYDHIHHNYIIIQVSDGERTRFHEKKTKWGFPNLISLDSFKDPENGYLFKDSCVFGAEVFAVPKYVQKDECLTMIKPPSTTNTHTWRIENFSALTQDKLHSEDFKVGKVKWILSLYPKGHNGGKGTHLSIYLGVHEADLLPNEWRVIAKYKLLVENRVGGFHESVRWFYKPSDAWGFPRFMSLSELKDKEKGFLVNDTLIVEAEVSIVGILKDI